MITNYRPNKRRSLRLVKFLSPLVVVGLIYFLSLTSIFQPLERLALAIVRPFWRATTASDEVSDAARIAILERQLLATRLDRVELEDLRQIFGRPAEVSLPKAVGRVLVRPPESFYDTLIIDVGQKSLVKLGDLVVADGAVALGEIVEVYPAASKVRLYSWADYELMVTVDQAVAGVSALGRGDGNFKLSLPRDLDLATSTLITISAAGRELLLAVVGDVERTASNPFQYVYARSPINLYQLTQVEIYDSPTFNR